MIKFKNYNDYYWSQLPVKELRKILFDHNRLDSERKRAKQELVNRTYKYPIDDVL